MSCELPPDRRRPCCPPRRRAAGTCRTSLSRPSPGRRDRGGRDAARPTQRSRDGAATNRPTTPRPVDRPRNWAAPVNQPFGPANEAAVWRSIERSQPYGSESWPALMTARLGIGSTPRPRGRSRNCGLGPWPLFRVGPDLSQVEPARETRSPNRGADRSGPSAAPQSDRIGSDRRPTSDGWTEASVQWRRRRPDRP